MHYCQQNCLGAASKAAPALHEQRQPRALAVPVTCLCCPQDTRQLFRDKVLHIVADDVGLGLARELGATCDTSTETVLQVLTAWSDQQTAAAAASDAKATAAADTSAAASTPPAAAALAGEQAAATTGGFTATLSDMAQLYHHLFKQLTPSAGAHSSSASAPAELPRRGFSALQDPGVKLSPEIKSRMRVSKAFSEVPLIWLPDTDEVLRAAAAVSRAAESEQRSYMDEEAAHSMMSSAGRGGAGGFGGRGGGAAGGFAGGRTGANRRGGGRQGAGVSAKQQQQQQAASDDPVADDVMYDAALISSVAHTPMRGRFYGIEQLRFTDDARVFEVTYPVLHKHYGGISNSSTSGSAAQPPPMLRVLGRYYGSLQELFVDVLQVRFLYGKCGRAVVQQVVAVPPPPHTVLNRLRHQLLPSLLWPPLPTLSFTVCCPLLLCVLQRFKYDKWIPLVGE